MMTFGGMPCDPIPVADLKVGDYIEYRDECCRRPRLVMDVHIGRKHKYVSVKEPFRENLRKVPFKLIVTAWRPRKVDHRERATENC